MTEEERRRLAELFAIEQRSEEEETEFRGLMAKASADPEPAGGEQDEGARTVGEMTAEQFAEIIGQGIGAAVTAAVAPRAEVRAPVPYGEAGRTEPSWADRRRYASLIAQYPGLEGIRTPENDLHIAQWATAQATGDRAGLAELRAQAPELYADARDCQRELARAPFITTTALAAGNLVPDPLSASIVELRETIEVIGPRSQQSSTASGTELVNTEGVVITVAGKTENDPATPVEPTFPQVAMKVATAIGLVESSRENDEDSAYSLVSTLTSQAGRAFAVFNDAQDADGSNVKSLTQDTGINEVSMGGAITEAAVTAMWYREKGPYRRDAFWIADGGVLEDLDALRDGNGNRIFFHRDEPLGSFSGGQGGGTQGSMKGNPVLESPGLDGATLMFGSLAAGFRVLTKGGMLVESTTVGGDAFVNHGIKWKFVQRRDSAVVIPEAFERLVGIV